MLLRLLYTSAAARAALLTHVLECNEIDTVRKVCTYFRWRDEEEHKLLQLFLPRPESCFLADSERKRGSTKVSAMEQQSLNDKLIGRMDVGRKTFIDLGFLSNSTISNNIYLL